MKKFIIILSFISVTSCTTPSKQSKISSLVDTGEAQKSEDILKDLSRTVYLKKMVKKQGARSADDKEAFPTSTWVKIYPYTEPLIKALATKKIEEQAFKENWTEDKKNLEMNKKIQADVKSLVTNKQCFAIEINTDKSEAINLKYWHGTLTQKERPIKLEISKGAGFTQTTRTTYLTGARGFYAGNTYDTTKYFYFAQGCSPQKIDLTENFSITIDVRFEKDLVPIELSWLKPEQTQGAAVK